MEKLRFVMSLRKSHDAFRKEMAVAENDLMLGYFQFLRKLGFVELVHHVMTAAVMYPRSMDACRDCVNDLSHSLYQIVGTVRLTHEAQERLTHLVDIIGSEIIELLEPHRFYETSFNSLWSHYDDVTAVAEVKRISVATFEVMVAEYRDDDGHRELSNKSFGAFQTFHWSH